MQHTVIIPVMISGSCLSGVKEETMEAVALRCLLVLAWQHCCHVFLRTALDCTVCTQCSLRAPETSGRSAWRSCRTVHGRPSTSWKHLRLLHSHHWALRRKGAVRNRVSSLAPLHLKTPCTDLSGVTVVGMWTPNTNQGFLPEEGRLGPPLHTSNLGQPFRQQESLFPTPPKLLLSESCSFCTSPDM